jgi:non-homologous end joining protein Ku
LALIDEKQQGKEITVRSVPKKAAVLDLMDALKRSLAATSKGSAKMAIPTKQKSPRRLRAR